MSLEDLKDFGDVIKSICGGANAWAKDITGTYKRPRHRDKPDEHEPPDYNYLNEEYTANYATYPDPADRISEWEEEEQKKQALQDGDEKKETALDSDEDEDDETDDDKTVDEQITEGWTPVEQAVLDEDIRAALADQESQELLNELEAEVSAQEAESSDADDADSDDGGGDGAGSSGGESSGDAGSDVDWGE